MSQLFDENKDNMRIVEDIEVRINDMMAIEPKVASMQQEMNKLIFNLPRGEYSDVIWFYFIYFLSVKFVNTI